MADLTDPELALYAAGTDDLTSRMAREILQLRGELRRYMAGESTWRDHVGVLAAALGELQDTIRRITVQRLDFLPSGPGCDEAIVAIDNKLAALVAHRSTSAVQLSECELEDIEWFLRRNEGNGVVSRDACAAIRRLLLTIRRSTP